MAKSTKKAAAPASNTKAPIVHKLEIDRKKVGAAEKPSIADLAEGILKLLTGYTPDEQTSILNVVVKGTVLRRAEGLDIAAKHANQSSAELKNFLSFHPVAEKYLKEHDSQKQ
jgi:hypothetical protein